MNAGLGLEIERILHFFERRGDPVLFEAFIDEKEQFKLFARQHGVTCSKNVPGKSLSENRNKYKTKITVPVWFSKLKLGGRSKIHQNEVDRVAFAGFRCMRPPDDEALGFGQSALH